MKDKSTGPIPKDQFSELAKMPFGAARKKIQEYDPMWGLAPGEKIEFEVKVYGNMHGRAIVKAANQEEADKLADKLNEALIDWDHSDDIEVVSVEPYVRRR